jgi:hypothetical protein
MWLPTAIPPHRAFVQALRIVLGSILVATIACRSARISGTYVAHGTNFVSSLSLTQAEGSQITGVLNVIQLSGDGKISSDDIPVTSGTLDGKQLTLTLNPGLLGLHPSSLGKNIAGTMEGDSARPTRAPSSNGLTSTFLFSGFARARHWPPWRRRRFDSTALFSTSRTTRRLRLKWKGFEHCAGL